MQGSPSADAAHEAAGFTGRFTAGLRFVESTCVPQPILPSDPLAGILAGERGLALAKQELEQLTRDQGPGKHLRVPARSRLIDDMLDQEIAAFRSVARRSDAAADGPSRSGSGSKTGTGSGFAPPAICCQVISLGAGMCTRPWRLACLAGCAVFELDLPHIAATKTALLTEATAQTTSSSSSSSTSSSLLFGPRGAGDNHCDGGCNPTSHRDQPDHHQQQQQQEQGDDVGPPPPQQQRRAQPAAFPLLASSYACIGADLSAASATETLSSALLARGFQPGLPTIWVLEALLYYMPLGAASELLCALAGLSAPGSRLITTCVDRQLLEASRRGVPKGHVFADLWHFDTEALLYDTRAFGECWAVDWAGQPPPEFKAGPDAAAAAAGGGDGGADAGLAADADADASSGDADPHQAWRRLPASTRRLAKERLSAETYVALYGGSELLFVSGLQQQQPAAC